MTYDPYSDIKYFESFTMPFSINNSFRWVEIQKCHWCGEKDIIITFDEIKEKADEIICPVCQSYLKSYTKIYRKHFRKVLLKRYFKSLLGI